MQNQSELEFNQGLESHNRRTYINLKFLGSGGSGDTYLVLCTSGPHSGHLFAAKIFRSVSKPERRLSFLQEHAFLRDATHPAIMRVFDDGFFLDERPFFIAEYLPQTLHGRLHSVDRLFTKLSYALQLLSALAFLERNEVVHRDIKPRNIFVKVGTCVLGDFGLMKRCDSHGIEPDREVLKGSLGAGMPRSYRTPDLVEYLKGRAAPSPKSDVFQLGLVLAELFTGMNPQRPMSKGRFTSPVKLKPIPPITGMLGDAIGRLITDMLTFDPAVRPSASKIYKNWEGLFIRAAKEEHDLEGAIRPVG